jgi:hypothetical protein
MLRIRRDIIALLSIFINTSFVGYTIIYHIEVFFATVKRTEYDRPGLALGQGHLAHKAWKALMADIRDFPYIEMSSNLKKKEK